MSDQNETYVQEHWERAELCETVTGPYLKWSISLGGRGFTRACIPENWAKSEAEAWLAARQFTEERLEALRQVEEEIHCLDYYISFQLSAGAKDDPAILTRILASRQAALTDLQCGLKPGGSNE